MGILKGCTGATRMACEWSSTSPMRSSKQPSCSDDIKSEQASTSCYDLDNFIESDGTNLSVGEISLLSLGCALVKDCKVVVLDEATLVVYSPPPGCLMLNSFQIDQSHCMLGCKLRSAFTLGSLYNI
ncbi:hypothetical protein EDB19DRAFT_1775875 [Suillus lakei]|nr:hypothetical protein EDB19DRAFT_1775875 [Suillus lakei]